jgi:hypothetical protein
MGLKPCWKKILNLEKHKILITLHWQNVTEENISDFTSPISRKL